MTLAVLFTELVPLALVFMIASAIALVVNYPSSQQQRERLTSHGEAAMLMVTTIFAAGVFTGILTKSGMLASMAQRSRRESCRRPPCGICRSSWRSLSMPLSLVFDPDSFYFGLLPVLSHAADVGGRIGNRGGAGGGARTDDDGIPGQPADPGDVSAGRTGQRRSRRSPAPHDSLRVRDHAADGARRAGDGGGGLKSRSTPNLQLPISQGESLERLALGRWALAS